MRACVASPWPDAFGVGANGSAGGSREGAEMTLAEIIAGRAECFVTSDELRRVHGDRDETFGAWVRGAAMALDYEATYHPLSDSWHIVRKAVRR